MLFDDRVLRGKITENEFDNVINTNAARIFNMFPKKGIIAVGSDEEVSMGYGDGRPYVRFSLRHCCLVHKFAVCGIHHKGVSVEIQEVNLAVGAGWRAPAHLSAGNIHGPDYCAVGWVDAAQ